MTRDEIIERLEGMARCFRTLRDNYQRAHDEGHTTEYRNQTLGYTGGLEFAADCVESLVRQAGPKDSSYDLAEQFIHETEAGLPSKASTQAVAQVEAVPGQEHEQYEPPILSCQGGICCTSLADEVAALIEREVRI